MDLPENRISVARFLKDKDLCAAARVCKSWNVCFTPTLYYRVQWSIVSGRPSTRGVRANGDHIRVLGLFMDQTVFTKHCTKLESVIIETSLWNSEGWTQFLELLRRNPDIKSVDISHSSMRRISLVGVMEALSSLSSLSKLEIRASWMEQNCMELIFDMAVRLEKLTIYGFMNAFPESFERWPCFPAMQVLHIDGSGDFSTQRQLEIIRRCPELRSLTWEDSATISCPTSDLYNLFKTQCPKIEELDLRTDWLSTDKDLAMILDTFRPLAFLRLNDPQFGEMSFQALTKHFASLRQLHFDALPALTNEMVQRIMTSCPNLTRLSAVQLKACHILGFPDGEKTTDDGTAMTQPTSPQDWVCTRLEFISITICGLEGKPQDWNRGVLRQLGRLRRLDTLRVGQNSSQDPIQDGLDFRMEAGLDELTGLKWIRDIDFGNSHQQLEEQDVQWMIKEWPSLESVEGKLNNDRKKSAKFRKMLEKGLEDYQFYDYGDEDEYDEDSEDSEDDEDYEDYEDEEDEGSEDEDEGSQDEEDEGSEEDEEDGEDDEDNHHNH
ncbi:hypothetical protein B0O80DRAFT_463018 [Mortierella sp. GBAus27b]|nr:hypothetical protein BGX31_005772 [Mortierella sp. GBA43]KAI8348402.1 hypothetical protein B0O80DRAFT_463018 [Mortierella sp. GBAus27b]